MIVYKYPLAGFQQTIPMPDGAIVLTAQMQYERITLWALVDASRPLMVRHFRVVGTGHEMADNNRDYIQTVQDGPYVWHVFEVLS